jgi:hypothetical protein
VSPIITPKARDLVGIVQGGVGDGDAADEHRLELGHRGHGAGAADLELDVLQRRHLLLGRELVGGGPAQGAGHKTELLGPSPSSPYWWSSFIFSSVANWTAAPFNGLLAEKVEQILTGEAMNDTGMLDVVKDVPVPSAANGPS